MIGTVYNAITHILVIRGGRVVREEPGRDGADVGLVAAGHGTQTTPVTLVCASAPDVFL